MVDIKRVNHDLRSNNGSYVQMPPYYQGESGWGNLALPDVYSTDDASALYPRGTKFVEGERVFYYGKYLGDLTNDADTSVNATNGDDLGGKFLFTSAYQTDMADSLLVRKIAGEISIAYQTTVSAARSDDYYSGGWVTGKDTTPSDERMFWRRIVAHDYEATGLKETPFWSVTNEVTTLVDLSSYSQVSVLELDQKVINSKTSMATTLMPNPWKHIVWYPASASSQYYPAMGACMHNDPTATYNVWLQTWGEMFCPHITNANIGASNFEVIYYIMGDGSIQGIDGSTDTYGVGEGQYQMAGVAMANTVIAAGSGADESLPMIFVMLRK